MAIFELFESVFLDFILEAQCDVMVGQTPPPIGAINYVVMRMYNGKAEINEKGQENIPFQTPAYIMSTQSDGAEFFSAKWVRQ